MTEDEVVGWHHQLSEHEFKQSPGDSEGQGILAWHPWGWKGQTQLNNNNKNNVNIQWKRLLNKSPQIAWKRNFSCWVEYTGDRFVNILFRQKLNCSPNYLFSSVQSLSHVQLFAAPWIAAHQASLSITNSWSWLKLMSIESVMPSSHLILCRALLLLPPIPPRIRVFSNESVLRISTGVSASASVQLSMNIQDWFPLGWTGLISLQSKGLSKVFSSTIIWKHQFFGGLSSLWSSSHTYTWLLESHSFE